MNINKEYKNNNMTYFDVSLSTTWYYNAIFANIIEIKCFYGYASYYFLCSE